MKNPLDKEDFLCYNIWHQLKERNFRFLESPRTLKNFKKVLKKYLTNGIECDIIYRLSTRSVDEHSGQQMILEN